jgi:cysteinyl-tRNA synthetase
VDDGYDPLDYRYFLLGGHYRSQLQFSQAGLDGAKNARKSLMDKLSALFSKAGGTAAGVEAARGNANASEYLHAFDTAIEDDLNTPRALAELWGLLRDAALEPEIALSAAFDMDTVLGLGLRSSLEAAKPEESEEERREIEEIIARRTAAKQAKDFATADALRQSLKERGIALEDGAGGTSWRRV